MPAVETSSAVEIKRTSLILVIFLTCATSGIYIPIWFLTRRRAINALRSEEKLGKGILILATVIFTVATVGSSYLTVLDFMDFIAPLSAGNQGLLMLGLNAGLNVISLVAFIPVIYEAFKVKRILDDHLNYLGKDMRFSKVWTFLLMNIYLQYRINRLEAPGLAVRN